MEDPYQVECVVDSGAGCNVMSLYMYKSLFGNNKIVRTPVQIFGYGDSPITNRGVCAVTIHTDNKQ